MLSTATTLLIVDVRRNIKLAQDQALIVINDQNTDRTLRAADVAHEARLHILEQAVFGPKQPVPPPVTAIPVWLLNRDKAQGEQIDILKRRVDVLEKELHEIRSGQ